MIRKVIIVTLTLATLGIGVLWGVDRWATASVDRFWSWDLTNGRPTCECGGWCRLPAYYVSCRIHQHRITLHWHLRAFSTRRKPGSIVDLGPLRYDSTSALHRVSMPFWVPFVGFAAYPTAAFIRGPLRRRRRRERGLCVSCGYDLTGNVSGVCSECGAEIEQA